jgi:REP element-mobilizing transposase RayT
VHFHRRKRLPHDRPAWVSAEDPIFLTLCGAPRKVNQFCEAKAWQAVICASQELTSLARWRPLLIVAMPDHLHLIAKISRGVGVDGLMTDLKCSISLKHSIVWQRDGFDHRLRSRAELRAKWQYVRLNPVRAGLCADPDAWPYVFRAG